MVTDRPAVGEIWKEGSIRWYIVATEDDGFIYVKRADNAKKVLARAAGGYPVAPSDYQNWVKVND